MNFQGCFTVQLSLFFIAPRALRSQATSYILPSLSTLVNNFFQKFFRFRLSQTSSSVSFLTVWIVRIVPTVGSFRSTRCWLALVYQHVTTLSTTFYSFFIFSTYLGHLCFWNTLCISTFWKVTASIKLSITTLSFY